MGLAVKPNQGLCSSTCQLNPGELKEIAGLSIQPESLRGLFEIESGLKIYTGKESLWMIVSFSKESGGGMIVLSVEDCAVTVPAKSK